MATIRHTIAINATAQQAVTEIHKWQDAVVSIAQTVDRYERQLSGDNLLKSAHNYTQAIANMGGATDNLIKQENILQGVSKLTAAEKANVNRKVAEAIEKYEALGQKAPTAMRQLHDATKPIVQAQESWTQAVIKNAAGYVAGMVTWQAAQRLWREGVQFIKESIDEWGKQEAAVKKVTVAMQAQGTATPQMIAAYQALANQFQRTTIYGDDLTMEMQALLIQVGDVMPSEMSRALQASADLASGLGVDLRTATLLVGKAFAGETGTLTRYGIVIDKAKLQTQGITAILDALQDKFGGQAQSQLETYSGRLEQISNYWGDFKEEVGKAIVQSELVNDVMAMAPGLILDATNAIGKLNMGYVILKGGVYAIVAGLAEYAKWVGLTAQRSLELMKTLNPLTNAFGGVDKQIAQWAERTAVATLASDFFAGKVQASREELAALMLTSKDAGPPIQDLGTKVRGAAVDTEKLKKEQEKAAEATKKFRDSVKAIDSDGVLWNYYNTLPDLGNRTAEFRNELAGLTKDGLLPVTNSFAGMIDKLPDVQSGMDSTKKAASGLATALEEDLKRIPQIMVQALTGGGGLAGAMEAIGSMIGATLGKAIGESIGRSIGGLAGKLAGPLGEALGSLLGPALGAALNKILKTEGRKVNDLRDLFVDAAGGLEELNQHAQDAGTTLNELLRADTVEEYERAVRNLEERFQRLDDAIQRYGMTWTDLRPERRTIALGEAVRDLAVDMRTLETAGYAHDAILRKQATAYNDLVVAAVNAGEDIPPAMGPILLELANMGLLSEQAQRALLGLKDEGVVDWQAMEDAAGRYGIKLEDLGPKFQAAKLHDGAQQLIDDWELLVGGGADLGAVMAGMDEQVTAMVANAIKYGIELPAGMKPIVEAMYNAGEFADDNGEKFEDLSQVKFAEPIEAQFGKVIEAIEALILKLGQIYDPTITPHWDDSEIPDWYDPGGDTGGAGDDEQMHRGGLVMHRGGFVAGHTGASYWAGGEAIARAHSGLAIDEVPIIAQTGEGILSRKGMGRLGRAALRELNEGGGFGGGGTGEADPRVLRAMDEQAAEIAMLRQELATVLPKAIRDSALLAKVS